MTFNGGFKGDLWQRVTTGLRFQIPELPPAHSSAHLAVKTPVIILDRYEDLQSHSGNTPPLLKLQPDSHAFPAGPQTHRYFHSSDLLMWPVLVASCNEH